MDASMTSWPDHLPSANQKRFWRDPVTSDGHFIVVAERSVRAAESAAHENSRRNCFRSDYRCGDYGQHFS
jgi:hypothetical protein